MNQLFPLFLFLAVGSLAVFSFLSVAVWSASRQREREAYYKAEVLKKIADSQGAGAASALEVIREQERIAQQRRREGLRLGGLVQTAIGAGLMILVWGVVQDQRPVFLVGVIPLFTGLAILLYSYVLAPKQ